MAEQGLGLWTFARAVFGAAAVAAAVAGSAVAQKAEGEAAPAIAWEEDLDAALARAKADQKPLFVAFLMDDEPANDEVVNQHFTDPEVRALAARMVCLVGNLGKHADGPCPKFGCASCEVHTKIEIKARARWLKTDIVRAPQFVFCSPDGAELFRKVYLIPKQELRKSMTIALAGKAPDAGAELAQEQAKVDTLLKDADSRNAETRDAAFRGLAEANDPRALPALLAKAKAGNDDPTRESAIRSLGTKGHHAAVIPLIGLLADKSTRIQICALRSLAVIELPEPAADVLVLLKKEQNNARIRGRALRTLAKCWPEGAEVRKQCIAGLKGSAQVLDSSLMAIFDLKPDPQIVAAIKPLLAAKRENTRALAVWILGKQKDAALVATLQKVADGDKSPDVQRVAHKALSFSRGEKVESYEGLYSPFFYETDV